MKWFQVDSDTPNDPKIKRLLDRSAQADGGPSGAAEAMGRLFLLWCFIANHGQGDPGMAVKADGSPLDWADMAYECRFRDELQLKAFLAEVAMLKLIDPAQWLLGIVFLPAMRKRADDYAKRKGRGSDPGRGDSGPVGEPGGKRGTAGQDRPIQDTTTQDTTTQKGSGSADLLADAGEDNADALVRIWNTERKPGPSVRDVTPQRRERYRRALKAKPDLSDWRTVIVWLNGQPWCNAKGGGDHPTWRATLDWLAKPGKLAEYLDKVATERPARDGVVGRQKGRTGYRPGEFAQALGDDDAIH